jgi:DNA-binding SARP family transcriptional activator
MLSALEFRILGPLQVLNTKPVLLRARKQRTLLAALLLHSNTVVPTDRLIEYLWDDESPANPRAALQIHVARLRKILKAKNPDKTDLIQAQTNGYLIEVSEEQLDLRRFQLLCDQIAQGRHRGDPNGELGLINEALSLWRGPVLADVGSDKLRRDEAPLLTEQWLAVLERRFDVELWLGRHAHIIGDLRMATGTHPLQENLWRQLMIALYQSGRRAEAVQAYHNVAGILRDELGLDPRKELTYLYQQILRADSRLTPGNMVLNGGFA